MPSAVDKSALLKESYTYALSLLARRDYSKVELQQRIIKRFGLEDSECQCVLSKLESDGYQSDKRYAEAYVRYRGDRGFGPIRLKQELSEQGVSPELIRETLEESCEVDWDDQLQRVWQKKFRNPPDDWRGKAKQLRFLSYRGFEPARIERFLDSLSDFCQS